MAADPRDDFGIFAEHEHMFFGLADPYAMIREETEGMLRKQVDDASIQRIEAFAEPKWLTLGRKIDGEPGKVQVGHYGFCFRCFIDVESSGRDDRLDATLTFLFIDIDRKGQEKMRLSIDLFDDATTAFGDDVFQNRFLAFRDEHA